MATIDQVATQIRFGLEQLSARNAHHEFEHLCRYLTRARICSNVLPATGPVGQGGDQGRDFETFRTYLSNSTLAETAFVGLVSDKPLVFACTLQKQQIKRKIKFDIKKIMSSGSTVEGVHYFCSASVPIATRHDLINWARKTHSVALEIHDGESLAELLSGRDVFWIAEQYLSVPSEIYPRSPIEDGGEWYVRELDRWKAATSPPVSYADFSTLKAAGRHALNSENLCQDVPFWFRLIESFIDADSNTPLRRRAIYEAAYLSLKYMKTLVGQENRLREYFSVVPDLEEPADLEDAYPMMNYCAVIAHEGSSALTVDEVSHWRRALIARVEEKLAQYNTTNTRCLLLDLRGALSTSMDPANPVRPTLDEAIEWWNKALDEVKDAPLYPLERLADRLTNYLKFFHESADYRELAKRLDSLLAQRSGEFTAAEKCFERAEVLYEKGHRLEAINHLHDSKIKWFAAETLARSVRSMLFISHCYAELGLEFAAKYYALAAAYVALKSNDPNVLALSAAGLAQAAECEYSHGAWCGFAELADIYLRSQVAFVNDPRNIERYPDLRMIVWNAAHIKFITQRLAPPLSSFIDENINYWGIEDWVRDIDSQVGVDWERRDVSEIWKILNRELRGIPFSDVGPQRNVQWSELGIKWNVTWANDYETTIAAEQFIAVLQIFLAELAEVDLCLLKTDVQINLNLSSNEVLTMTPHVSNEGRQWDISLPMSDSHVRRGQETAFDAAVTILDEISLVPERQYIRILKRCFQQGLRSKLMVAQSYGTIYRSFVPKDFFDHSDRDSKQKVEPPLLMTLHESEELGWRGGPGPDYSREKAEKMLKARYSGSIPPIRITLRKLIKDEGFKATLNKLRAEGWLDWHLLNAMSNIAVNYRVMHMAEAQRSEEAADRIGNALMNSEEREDAIPIPTSVFSEHEMRQAVSLSMIHTLRLFGLELRQLTPDLKAIDHFLRIRYNYWTDDIKHEDIFPAETMFAGT
jgi:hypothetical protein